MNKYDILKQYFGFSSFRDGQESTIDRILEGRDVLGIMPTGAGKSLCYQIPALLMQGVLLVVSPLISLMKDQVASLNQAGIKAAYINSSLTERQYHEVVSRASGGVYKIIYVAPERLLNDRFLELCNNLLIPMVTIDEAHCVSQWGHDFRPSYLEIPEFIRRLPFRPVLSTFTATATEKVKEDIIYLMQLQNPYVTATGFDRKNLYFEVKRPGKKLPVLTDIIQRNVNKSGIVYCATRKTVEDVCRSLIAFGINATRYHAGLSPEERHNNQEDFLYDRKTVMVATNAFGMGIDKSNVAYVVHYNMPKNIESYYQEAGRAGRDGENASCILLYSAGDVAVNRFLISHSQEENEKTDGETRTALYEKDMELLKQMTYYCTTTDCLRNFILKYFGEGAPSYCGNCSSCLTNFDTIDISIEAQKIISCVYRLRQSGRSFGKVMVIDILRGSKNQKLKSFNLDRLSTYGIMAEVSSRRIRAILDYLIECGYLGMTSGDYSVVTLTKRSDEIVREFKSLSMKLPRDEKPSRDSAYSVSAGANDELLEKLKALRTRFASEAGVPAYVIFTDSTLRSMAESRPQDKYAFLDISGVGKVRMERYGEAFMKVIKEFSAISPDQNV